MNFQRGKKNENIKYLFYIRSVRDLADVKNMANIEQFILFFYSLVRQILVNR